MPNNWKDLSVPRKMMQEGIDLCKKNITDYLQEAELFISQGRLNHATILVEFAVEEFGKMLIIKRAFALDLNDPFTMRGKKFYDHGQKSKKAWTVLDKKFRTLFDEGICLPNTVFEHGLAVENTQANHDTRCWCAFVDFCSGRWLLGCDIKEGYLKNLVEEIKDKLLKL